MKEKNILICTGVRFYTRKDEDAFFERSMNADDFFSSIKMIPK